RLLKLYPTDLRVRSCIPPDQLKYEIIHTSLEQFPSYEAVSYAWGGGGGGVGGSSRDHKIPLRRGITMQVTESVEMLLRFVSPISSTGYLWIDQLCINQDNQMERGHQVSIMRNIYSDAKRTIVWLGEADEASDLIFSTLDVIGRLEDRCGFSDSVYDGGSIYSN
ncbi:heterokaryon incompatibility protein-domain-containing protein, partial [Macrophomina phaseolina]